MYFSFLFLFLIAYLLFLTPFFAGCIRVAGKTGFWYQGSGDEAPKEKTVGFDTQDLTQKDKNPGSIEV